MTRLILLAPKTIDDNDDYDDDNFIQKKRNRIVIEPTPKSKIPKQYGVMKRPPNRNDYDYNEDPYDFDSSNIPGDRNNSYIKYEDLGTKKYESGKSKNVYEY